MQLALSLTAPSSGARTDVLLEVASGTPLSEVRDPLLARLATGAAAPALHVAGRPLPDHAPLGQPPLVRGALLAAGQVARSTGAGPALQCLTGPQAGGRWVLPPGSTVLGRGPSSGVQVDDPLLSRAHLTLQVAPSGEVTVVAQATTNGTSLDGAALGSCPVPLSVGAVLSAGASRFGLVPPDEERAPVRADGAGLLSFNRPPRRREPADPVHVHLPDQPPVRERRPFPVLAVLAPVLLGLVLWRVLGSATFLLFTLLSPVLVLGTAMTDLRAGRRQTRRDRERWRRDSAAALEQLASAVSADERRRRTSCPDPGTTVGTALASGERLWERREEDDDVLRVALGRADQAASVQLTGAAPPHAATARDVPLVVALREAGVLGLAGADIAAVRSVARWAVVQAAVWHSPRDLEIVVLADGRGAPAWEWARWLPHTRPASGQDCRALLGFGAEQAAARVAELRAAAALAGGQHGARRRRVLLVVDGGHALRAVPGLAALLDAGPQAGVHTVVVDADRRLLPQSCRATAEVGVDDGTRLDLHVDGRLSVTGAAADGVPTDVAEQVARALAPLRDVGGQGVVDAELPAAPVWRELVGLPLRGEAADADALVERWVSGASSTVAPLGVAPDGVMSVDLRADGPHALVAGTTGSGKSELLQTWIASLVVGNRPDALNLVLVDYKGGAAFGPCARLPHVAGLVTDLDGALAARALASLGAELRRREVVLAAAQAKDLEAHRRLVGGEQSLARLVIVVDEFAALAEELPDFVEGLVDIARRGRSLGVHLVLATQRPGGVVSADIRANTNLRLCLAVARDTDSRDVLDSPLAAQISRATPGRAFVRTGHGELTALQVARVNAPRRRPSGGRAVMLLPVLELGDPLPRPAAEQRSDDAPTELALLVEACAQAAVRCNVPAPRPLWLPPLPPSVTLDELPPYADPLAADEGRVAPPSYGLLDLPEQQRHASVVLDLDRSTHLLVVGAPRTGRTTALRTLAGALAATVSPDDVHLYVVDATGHGLSPLDALPHVGAVVARGEEDRLQRMLARLAGEVVRRQEALAASGHAGVTEQRAASGPEDRLPHLVLLVDGVDALVHDHQDRDAGRLLEVLHALLRDGPRAGLHVVLSGDRSALRGRLAALVDTRLVLRMADRGDSALAGVPDRLVQAGAGPGRGWLLDGGAPQAVQVALLAPDPSGEAQASTLAAAARAWPAPVPGRGPQPFRSLPRSVALADLHPPDPLPHGCVVLGAGGDEALAVVVDVTSGFLVGGPPESGRSTALCTVAAGLRRAHLPFVVLAPRPSPLRAAAPEHECLVGSDDVAGLEALLARGPRVVLVDDAELLVGSPLAPVLERIVRLGRDTGASLVAAGTTDDLVAGYRGFVVDLRRSRTGLLLSPQGPGDGELLGARLSRHDATPLPGRGVFCVRGQVEPVQVAAG